jgi:CRP-like cAMP-binding protein
MANVEAIGALMADREPNFLGLFSREPNVLALKAGETLFQKGDPARSMYVVLRSMYVVLKGELRIGDGNAIYERLLRAALWGKWR